MRILVIGGTGFIGTPLVAHLVGAGHEVAVFSRGEKRVPEGAGITPIKGTRADFPDTRAEIVAFDPAVSIDIFAMTTAETDPVIDTLAPLGGRYVMLSSCDVYLAFGRLLGVEPGEILEGPLTEASPLRETLYPYRDIPNTRFEGYDKIPLETRCFEVFEDWGTVLRLPMIVGRGDPQHRFRDPVAQMSAGRPAILLPEEYARWKTTYGHIDNVVAAIAHVATDERAGGETFNVAGTPVCNMGEWYHKIAETLGWEGEITCAPASALPAKRADLAASGNLAQNLEIDASKLRKKLGFKPPMSEKEMLVDVADWEAGSIEEIPADAFDFSADDKWLENNR